MRSLAVTAAAGVLLVLLAVPALAQRDPFAPRAEEGTVSATTSGGGGVFQPVENGAPARPTGAGPVGQPAARDNGERDRLPVTGQGASSWLVLAYALVALGAGAIALGRTFARPA